MIKNVYSVRPDTTIEEAAAILLEQNISGLPVVDEQNRLVGIINQIDLFRVILSLTGRGKKGVQIAVRVKDMPGPIKEMRELVLKYGGRTASILSSGESAPSGYLNLYFRIYQIDRDKLPSLTKDIEEKGTILYVVDHKEDKRTLYNSK
ncbi:MAG: CBS domain-containing protein [Deltaproteobacteria bacterium]|nr:CBS domain-containing protein [Deltaproteobacteria bacterium]